VVSETQPRKTVGLRKLIDRCHKHWLPSGFKVAGGMFGEMLLALMAPPRIQRTWGRELDRAGYPNGFYSPQKKRQLETEEGRGQELCAMDDWIRRSLAPLVMSLSLLRSGLNHRGSTPTPNLRNSLAICLQAEGAGDRSMTALHKVLLTPLPRQMDTLIDTHKQSMTPDETHLKVYNIDNYAHHYYRAVVQSTPRREHERTEGNYTGMATRFLGCWRQQQQGTHTPHHPSTPEATASWTLPCTSQCEPNWLQCWRTPT